MFSSRFHWDTRPNRLTRLLEEKREAGDPILDLTQSNPTRAGFDYTHEIAWALASNESLDYNPVPAGSPLARTVVSDYYAWRGQRVEPHRILLTASTSEAYAYLFKLLANPGDEVLVPRPSYPLFEFLAAMESVVARQYPLVFDGQWCIDMDGLTAGITERTRAIVVVSPNNPTGSYLKRREMETLVGIAGARGLALISDEVFADYDLCEDSDRVRSVSGVEDCLAFAMSGLSKVAGLPQMKLGWIVVAGPEDLRRAAFERLEWIADTYLSVATPVQCGTPALMRAGEGLQQQIRRRTRSNLEWLRRAIIGSAAGVLPVEGGWYAVVQVPRVRTEEEWTLNLLGHHDVLVQPGFFFDFPSEAFLVVSLLTDELTFREGIRRLLLMTG